MHAVKAISIGVFSLFALCGNSVMGSEAELVFDGKLPVNFRGCKQTQFPVGSWNIAFGALHPVVQAEPVDLVLRQHYTNFEFSVEWKGAPGTHGGIAYLAREVPSRSSIVGLTYAVDVPAKGSATNDKPARTCGSLQNLLEAERPQPIAAPQWNTTRILVITNHVEHWLNDRKVLEYTLGEEQLLAKASSPRFRFYLERAGSRGGYIALLHNKSEVWYRNLQVRRITVPAATPTPDLGPVPNPVPVPTPDPPPVEARATEP